MFASCRAISRFLNNDDIVAEVEGVMLLRSDLDEVMPDGLSAEDSTRLAVQYINTWATDIVFQKIAEQQLSKSEKDVTKELEDYRKSLLKYRYEQLYVNERLDTSVTDEMVAAYSGETADFVKTVDISDEIADLSLQITKITGADSLGYLRLEDVTEICKSGSSEGYCTACFDGNYPTTTPVIYKNKYDVKISENKE